MVMPLHSVFFTFPFVEFLLLSEGNLSFPEPVNSITSVMSWLTVIITAHDNMPVICLCCKM